MHNIPRMSGPINRITVIEILEKKHKLTHVITENLCDYMECTRQYMEGNRLILLLKNNRYKY